MPLAPFPEITGQKPQDVINQAAAAYNVPPAILTGVWGEETDFGANVSTSSAGAVGDFQFLPSTAQPYGYPLTNTPNPAQFAQQARAAAHYLSDLFHQHGGSWDAAIRAYSGGGYGLAQVQAKVKSSPQGQLNEPVLPSIPNPLSAVGDAVSGVFNQAVNDAKYAALLVVALFIAGFLIVHGIAGGGSGGQPRPVVIPV